MKNNDSYSAANGLVTIIVPCFNHAKYVAESIESVISQTYHNFECIVVDDGSTDNSLDIVRTIIKKDNRIRCISQKNSGPAAARNTGILNAKGKYIQFLDADDYISNEKIEKQINEFFNDKSLDIVYSDYLCFDSEDTAKTWTYSRVRIEGKPYNDFASSWGKSLSIPIHCFLYKKSCFDRWGMFDTDFLKSHEDWDLHLTFAFAGAKYSHVSGQTSFYRVCANSRARDENGMISGELMLLKKYIFKPKIPLESRWIFVKRYLEVRRKMRR